MAMIKLEARKVSNMCVKYLKDKANACKGSVFSKEDTSLLLSRARIDTLMSMQCKDKMYIDNFEFELLAKYFKSEE